MKTNPNHSINAEGPYVDGPRGGLTKREWYAGLIAASIANEFSFSTKHVSEHAVKLADALITELNKSTEGE
jgi:hypothetical protein